jgi:hypothetical protein
VTVAENMEPVEVIYLDVPALRRMGFSAWQIKELFRTLPNYGETVCASPRVRCQIRLKK